MSTTKHPRSKDIKIAVIETLREDATVAGWLYPDGAPTDVTDRTRVHEHDPGKHTDDLPAQISVATTLGGSVWRGGPLGRTYIVQLMFETSDDWYERWTGLAFSDLFDWCDQLLVHPPMPRVYPAGPESADPHEIQTGSSRRVAIGRWRFKTHRMTH